ncbi:unnamed protein product [Leptidea sinapis]|uniref:C2H2-type domain-containing protein n=1 Tax=Leptidea sinapis TaxID=189913 RepID=A0A5E4PP92_9NEOP|nr:unnamed protein product [Leptidea sinapis]
MKEQFDEKAKKEELRSLVNVLKGQLEIVQNVLKDIQEQKYIAEKYPAVSKNAYQDKSLCEKEEVEYLIIPTIAGSKVESPTNQIEKCQLIQNMVAITSEKKCASQTYSIDSCADPESHVNLQASHHNTAPRTELLSRRGIQPHLEIRRVTNHYSCDVCGAEFSDGGNLYRHRRALHSFLKSHSCDICHKAFSRSDHCRDHMKTHSESRSYVCDICGRTSKTSTALRLHKKVHTELKPYACLSCGALFKKQSFKKTAEYVIQSVDDPPYTKRCNLCNKEETLKELQRKVHSDDRGRLNVPCGRTFIASDYIKFMATHAPKYEAHSVGGSPTVGTFRQNKQSPPANQTSQTVTSQIIQVANIKVDTVNTSPRPPDVSKETESELSDVDDVEPCMQTPASVIEVIEESQDNPTKNASKCDKDSTTAATELPLESVKSTKHMRKRSCPLCDKEYTASSSYFYHMKHTHKHIWSPRCDECGRGFGTSGDLKQHSVVHTGELQYPCGVCGKKCRSRAGRYIHQETHKSEARHTCGVCGRGFRWRAHLARHEQRHAAERRHACTHCGRAFSVRCDLLRHVRTHMAAALACDRCDLTFAQPRYLKDIPAPDG